jgi:hypothetical protein
VSPEEGGFFARLHGAIVHSGHGRLPRQARQITRAVQHSGAYAAPTMRLPPADAGIGVRGAGLIYGPCCPTLMLRPLGSSSHERACQHARWCTRITGRAWCARERVRRLRSACRVRASGREGSGGAAPCRPGKARRRGSQRATRHNSRPCPAGLSSKHGLAWRLRYLPIGRTQARLGASPRRGRCTRRGPC